MPGCIFSVSGESFDPGPFLAGTSLRPYCVWRKGEPRTPRKMQETGGFSCDVSKHEDEIDGQIRDAIAFLKAHADDIRKLGNVSEVKRKDLDFGNWLRTWDDGTFFAQFTRLPPELLRLAGNLDVEIELSVYAPPGPLKAWRPDGPAEPRSGGSW